MRNHDSQPTFSIISVIKNIERRRASFRRCVESVLRQTCEDFEFVIQDGGSTDNTVAILSEYQDDRILVRSEPDSVHAEGMFRAFNRCRGKYVGSCWSDEELFPDALEKALAVFRKYPDIAAFYGNYGVVDENGNKRGPLVPGHPFSIEGYACQVIVPPFCSSFFSRDHLDRAGMRDHQWRYGVAEFEFWIRLANVGPIVYVPTDISYFGRHSQSDTNTASLYDRLMRERTAVMADLFEENRILRESGVTVNQAIAGNYAWAAASVFSIEGASDRYRRFVESVYAYDPHSPSLPVLIARLAGDRSVRESVRTVASVSPAQGGTETEALFARWIEVVSGKDNRLYYRDQSVQSLARLADIVRWHDPTVIVELGTLSGLSLRTWLAASQRARVVAVDLSFAPLAETRNVLPVDLSRVTLLEQDILKTDFARLWTPQDRVVFFVDAHDLPNVPIMTHVLTTALPSLPDGSVVVVDDLWFSEERLTPENVWQFLESHVLGEIDELQCFHAHFAPYHDGGSFLGFAEVIPLLQFVNEHGITLIHTRRDKHAFFVWKKAYLEQDPTAVADPGDSAGVYGSAQYNPLESVPVCGPHSETMRRIADLYRQRHIREAAESLSQALSQDPHNEGLSYGLAICLARAGMLSQARDILARNLSDSSHPRYRRLLDDLARRTGAPEQQLNETPQRPSETCGITIFAMPKAFTGHTATIQKNAIRSWARLDPMPEIILFGDEPGIREMAEEVRAKRIADVSRNEFGTPLVDKLFESAQEYASNTVLAYVNADMILFQDFVRAIQKVQARLESFLLIGQRWDLSVLDEIDFRDRRWRESLERQLQEHAMLHAECGLDYFVFRRGLWPQIPPFAIGRTAWDNWLVMDPYRRGVPVVDGTECITAVHQDHDYGHVSGGRREVWRGTEAERNRALAGPPNQTGLTSGTTWLLRKDGELVESPRRQPQYITALYREQRCTWLLKDARRLLGCGARELAASKCEEAVGCLDMWLQLRRLGSASSEPTHDVDIAGLYIASYTLLAQCCMQMGCHDRVVTAYTQLLDHPAVRMPAAQRNAIVQVRDRLARRLEAGRQPDSAPVMQAQEVVGLRANPPQNAESHAGRSSLAPLEGGAVVAPRPKVTVITSCHNGGRYLKECVESVLGQTMAEWELFLVDDGSTDDTRRTIEEYARRDARIRPFHFPDNRGPYVRRNFAIRRAASDFIVIHDADDIMVPTKLERLYAEVVKDSSLAMVGSFPRTFLEEFRGLEHTDSCDQPLDSVEILASCAAWQATISHGTAIIRKAFFDEIGLYDENPFAADAFWSAKLALYAETGAAVRVANVPEYLTLIRIHLGSQTQALPVFDPRNRRVRYRHYCECRLQRIREQRRRLPQLDVAAELRACDCSDFLTRFKAEILRWENEALPVHFVDGLLAAAVTAFRARSYVSCVVILNGLEVMQRDIPRRVMGFDLFRAMALHASGLPEHGDIHIRREIENHDSPVAHRFLQDSREQGALMAIHHWYAEHASDLELRLVDGNRVQAGVTVV